MKNRLRNSLFLLFVIGLGAAFMINSSSASPERWKSQGWKTDFSKTKIKFSEILPGGPPKDGIPSIDSPEFKTQDAITDIGKNEPVISLEINGDARAYPLRILMWHEIVNDKVGGKPVSVTYCPLCNSAIVFDRRLGDRLLDFGTTGMLRNSDMVMYDRQTESWWQQFTGEALVGELLGKELKTIPARVEAYELFQKRFPKGKVLVPNDPNMRNYGRNPYFKYDSRNAPYPLFDGDLPKDINPMARVIVFKVKGKTTAVTLSILRQKKSMTFADVTASWKQGQNSALDAGAIKNGRDVGNVVVQRKSESGQSDIVYDVTFAFVVNAFHPDLKIIQK